MKRYLKFLSAMLAISITVSACDAEKERHSPVVVYASYVDEAYLPELFKGFTRDTGIPVTVRYGEPAQLADDVIANRGSPPADVLLTRNVLDVWRAADEGALRPIVADGTRDIPDFLRDPDDLWVAMSLRLAVIAYNKDASGGTPETYADLADPAYRGTVCLSSSSLSVNRSLIAMLIAKLGTRPAEIVVRGWIRNLALPPYKSEQALIDAIEAGTCGYGVVSSSVAAAFTTSNADLKMRVVTPESAHLDIEGLGIARHAHYPESAQRLVDWLLSQNVQANHASRIGAYAAHASLISSHDTTIDARNIGLAAWHDEDAELLAERAAYR